MICSAGFTARGEVRLVGAHIGGQLNLSGATLDNADGSDADASDADRLALGADELTVDQAMICTEGFTAAGNIRLNGAHIGGQLNFSKANLTNPDPKRHTLALQDVWAGVLLLHDLAKRPGQVALRQAHVGALEDEPDSWPHEAILDGLVYDALYEPSSVSARERLGWLDRDPRGYRPQPYDQLAAVYRRAGRDHDARTVAIAKQWRRRRTLTPFGKLWNLLLYATVGYGYRMWLAIAWLLLLVGLGWWQFDRAHSPYPAHLLAAKPPGQRPWFHAALYALDLLLPFADLGYQGTWIATG
jgi:hypothetical protein